MNVTHVSCSSLIIAVQSCLGCLNVSSTSSFSGKSVVLLAFQSYYPPGYETSEHSYRERICCKGTFHSMSAMIDYVFYLIFLLIDQHEFSFGIHQMLQSKLSSMVLILRFYQLFAMCSNCIHTKFAPSYISMQFFYSISCVLVSRLLSYGMMFSSCSLLE